MSRRSSAVVLVAACVLPGAVGAQAADPPELPRLNCTKRIIDGEGDGYTNPTGVAPLNQIKTSGLDILSMFARTTDDSVLLFLQLKDIPASNAMEPYDLGYRYTLSFKHGTKTFAIRHLHANDQFKGQFASAFYPHASTPTGIGGITGEIDPVKDIVWVAIPRATVEEKSEGVPLTAGERITGLTATAEWVRGNGDKDGAVGDTVAPTGDAATWVIGDDFCFGPPPAVLSDVTATPVQFGDVSTLGAKLVDEKAAALANETVRFKIGAAAPATGTTDANGVVSTPFGGSLVAGTYTVTGEFLGTATAGKSSATGTLVVRPEVTKFAPLTSKKTSTTGRSVTATVLDDDGKPVAGQKVAWYVNGKLVSTLTTDAAGRSTFTGAKATQSVQARFAAVAGKYAAATSNHLKV